MKYATMKQHEGAFAVRLMCRVLSVSPSGYYGWCKRSESKQARARTKLDAQVKAEFAARKGRAGAPRLSRHLKRGRRQVAESLRRQGLRAKAARKFKATTNSNHTLSVAQNLLREDFTAQRPNQAWVSDLTYIRTEEGFLYAALITDAYSRKIVGAHIGDSLEAVGCLMALDKALGELPKDRHPLHHSDRGCQYCCHEYVGRLQARELPISMTEVMHCYENALAERVNGILKQEYEMDRTFRTKDQAKSAFEQAVWLYNHRRPHLRLNYRFPADVHAEAA